MSKIPYYEAGGTTMKEHFDKWRDFIHKNTEEDESYSADILYIQLEPRFKHFQPPLYIKIFKWKISMRWAYKIYKSTLLKDCVPVGMNMGDESKEITLEWKSEPFNSEEVDKAADNLKKKIEDVFNPMDYDGDYIYDKSIHAFRAPKYPGEKGDSIFDPGNLIFDDKCELLEGNKKENPDDPTYCNCLECHRYKICRECFYKQLHQYQQKPCEEDNEC